MQKNISDNIIKLSSQCIPNRDVLIRNNDPPWLDNNIRRYIRKRKRAYRKAKKYEYTIFVAKI